MEKSTCSIVPMGELGWQQNVPNMISPFFFFCEILVETISQSAGDDCSIEITS